MRATSLSLSCIHPIHDPAGSGRALQNNEWRGVYLRRLFLSTLLRRVHSPIEGSDYVTPGSLPEPLPI